VCTGARKLALSGLLDGKQATTHHDFIADFRVSYPKVHWLDSQRFVRAGDRLYTAGGLTSGIELALHLVAQRFGQQTAQATADYMEYRGRDWQSAD
jgi:transcriptional regulator GlxA family with amidase domain